MVSWRDKVIFLLILLPALLSFMPARAAETLSLSEAIEMAEKKSFGVESSAYDSAAAMYNYRAARSMRYPSLALAARSSYVDNVPEIGFAPGSTMELGTEDIYQADFTLSLPLYTGGRISSQIKINSENLRAGTFALEAERLKSAYDSRRAYLHVLLAEAGVLAAEASLERVDIIRRDVHSLYDSGLADSIDILETELAHEKTQLAVDEKRTSAANSMINLALILALPPDTELKLTEKITPPRGEISKTDESVQIDRAELKMLDSRIRAADYLSRLNSAEYFPTVSGFAGYSYGKPNRDFFNADWEDYWVAGLTLNWSLNLGGKTSHNINSVKQTAKSTRMLRNDTERALVIRAETSVENIKLAYRTVVTSKREFDIAGQKYRLADNKQKSGLLTVNRLLEIEAELTAAEQQYRASIINYYLARTEYLYAVGSEQIYGGL